MFAPQYTETKDAIMLLIKQLAQIRLNESYSQGTYESPLQSSFYSSENLITDSEMQNDNILDDDLRFLLKPKVPPAYYVCHNCFQHGHYIKNCPKAKQTERHTPYQGSKRSFGEFVCHKCKRYWTSCNSFAEIGQECRKCKVTVFPKKQVKQN